MNKRNAAAASNGGEEGTPATSDHVPGSGTFTLPSTSASDRPRNPFADDDDDDEDDHRPDLGSGSGSGSDEDDGDVDNAERGSGGGSAWNRGSWWRNVVRTTKRGSGKNNVEKETERFGDGRDDETDSDDPAADEEEDIEDEEFGDFAMPETAQASTGRMVSGIDPAREKLLLKPLPVHPSPGGAAKLGGATSPFGSLWPFSSATTAKDTNATPISSEQPSEKTEPTGAASEQVPITEEPIDLADIRADDEGVAVIVGEDGQKINRAVEATRRTSIEDPDDDEDVVDKVGGDEIIVGRPSGTAAAR